MSDSTAGAAAAAGGGALDPARLGRNFSSSSLGRKSPVRACVRVREKTSAVSALKEMQERRRYRCGVRRACRVAAAGAARRCRQRTSRAAAWACSHPRPAAAKSRAVRPR
jgi:hypothetical protein